MPSFRELIHEIHRRALWHALLLYAVAAFVIYRAVVELWLWLGLPAWLPPAVLLLLLVGLPIVLVTTYVQEADPEARATPTVRSTLFTWPKVLAVGALAFAAVGLAAAGYMGMRTFGIGPVGTLMAKGVLTEESRLLVADFSAPEEEALLGAAVAEALRIDLERAGLLRAVEDGSPEEGVSALLVGEVTPVGAGYRISARLLTPSSGEVVLQVREVADSSGDILGALDRLSSRIRERTGESLKSVRESPPLTETATSSIEALKLLTRAKAALNAGDDRGAVRLLERALERDSTFAAAWRALGDALTHAGEDPRRRREAYRNAVEHGGQLPEWKRLRALAKRHLRDGGDPYEAIDTYRRLVELRPDHWGFHNNLGIAYGRVGQLDRAEEALRRAVEADSTAHALSNLASYRIAVGDMAGARAVIEARARLFPDDESNRFHTVTLLYAEGDVEGAERESREGVEVASPAYRAGHLEQLATLRDRAGRLEEARRLRDEAAELRADGSAPDAEISRAVMQAWRDIMVRGRPAEAARRLDAAVGTGALETGALEAMPPRDRPYLWLAAAWAAAGEPVRARATLEEWRKVTPQRVRRRAEKTSNWAEGLTLIAEGEVDAGLDLLRRSTRATIDVVQTLPTLAWAYDRVERPDSALAAYHAYERLQHPARLAADATFLPLAYERMARLHEERGDRAEAVRYYRKFVDLWSDADPELQPRVDAARRALGRLTAESRG